MRRNKLSRIDSDAFSDVAASLEELHLNDNDLILNDSVRVAIFNGLTNLEKLSLHNNVNISDELLAKLNKLTTLSIDRSEY